MLYTCTSDLGNPNLKFNISCMYENIGFYSLSLQKCTLVEGAWVRHSITSSMEALDEKQEPYQHLHSSSTGRIAFLCKTEDNNVHPPTTWLLRIK